MSVGDGPLLLFCKRNNNNNNCTLQHQHLHAHTHKLLFLQNKNQIKLARNSWRVLTLRPTRRDWSFYKAKLSFPLSLSLFALYSRSAGCVCVQLLPIRRRRRLPPSLRHTHIQSLKLCTVVSLHLIRFEWKKGKRIKQRCLSLFIRQRIKRP